MIPRECLQCCYYGRVIVRVHTVYFLLQTTIMNWVAVCVRQSLSKGLISVASGLNHSKELRDFFVDLLETVSTHPYRQTPSDWPRLRFDVFMHWLCARYKLFLRLRLHFCWGLTGMCIINCILDIKNYCCSCCYYFIEMIIIDGSLQSHRCVSTFHSPHTDTCVDFGLPCLLLTWAANDSFVVRSLLFIQHNIAARAATSNQWLVLELLAADGYKKTLLSEWVSEWVSRV